MWRVALFAAIACVFLLEEFIAALFRRWYYTHGLVLRRIHVPVQAQLGEPTLRELELQFRHRLSVWSAVKLWPIQPNLLAFRYAYPVDVITGYISLTPEPQTITVCGYLDLLSIVGYSLLILFFYLSRWELAIVPALILGAFTVIRRRRKIDSLAQTLKAVWESPMPSIQE